jgi:hypothetical protein
VFVESHPRPHSPVLSPQRSDLKTFRRADDPYLAKSFPVNIFADPHPLNLYATVFYKKGGGRGLPDVPTFGRSDIQTLPVLISLLECALAGKHRVLPVFSRNHQHVSPLECAVPSLLITVHSKGFTETLTLLECALTKNIGGASQSNQISFSQSFRGRSLRTGLGVSSKGSLSTFNCRLLTSYLPVFRGPRVTDQRPCFKRTVAFPQHKTSRPLCPAAPTRTIEVHAGAESASHTRLLADGRRIATSWVR